MASAEEVGPHFISTADVPWRDVKRWAEDRMQMHRRVLETQGMSHDDTEATRAVIAELKELLNLPNPSKMHTDESESSD